MSRREDRDSDSKRRHSRFDREPSPKRYRRDAKQERDRDRVGDRDRDRDKDRDRVISGAKHNVANGDHANRDERNHRQLHDALSPLEPPSAHHSKEQAGAVRKQIDKKPNDHYEAPKHSPDPTQAPRSLSYSQQHDEQVSAGQVSRREAGERGWWKDSKNQYNERVETSRSREQQRGEKSRTKPDDNTFQRRHGFSERKDDPPPTTRKRPAFRENKISVDLGDANPVLTVAVKSSQTEHPPERNERKEERSSNPRHLDRPEKQSAEDRAPYKGEARRDGFTLRGRSGGSGGNTNYRGRDKFNGRQGYRPSKTQTEKWKHDLYQEVNEDPIPKNEDDQIAKLEALLAS